MSEKPIDLSSRCLSSCVLSLWNSNPLLTIVFGVIAPSWTPNLERQPSQLERERGPPEDGALTTRLNLKLTTSGASLKRERERRGQKYLWQLRDLECPHIYIYNLFIIYLFCMLDIRYISCVYKITKYENNFSNVTI